MQSTAVSDNSSPEIKKPPVLIVGYFRLRGRAQVPRLILEYLNIPYRDYIFESVKDWSSYKFERLKEWPMLQLPFLIDGDFRITETVPICNYIVSRYGRPEMLGKNMKDEAILNMYTWSIDNMGVSLVSLCWMQGTQQQIEEAKDKFWFENVQQKMQALECFIENKQWMFGYLSLFDFSIYELVHYVDIVFPHRIKEFQKLLRVETRIRDLPEIKKYESSPNAIKVYLPTDILKKSKPDK